MEHLTKTLSIVETDNGDLALDLGNELCEQLGWNVGDTIDWKDNGDGSWTLTKIQATFTAPGTQTQ
jgi:hypothetical protein